MRKLETDVGRTHDADVGRTHGGAEENGPFVRTHSGASLQRKSGTLGSIIAGFKSAATTTINELRKTPRLHLAPKLCFGAAIRRLQPQAELGAERGRLRNYLTGRIKWFYDEENPGNQNALPR